MMNNNEQQYAIRLPHRFGVPEDMFYCDNSPSLTTLKPEEATLMPKDRAHLQLGSIIAKSVSHHDLFTGSEVISESEMLAPKKQRPLVIYFHVRAGRTFEEGLKIREIVKAIVQRKYPDASVSCLHWIVGDNNFCCVSNAQPNNWAARDMIQQWVKSLILKVSEDVKHQVPEEIYDYAE